MKYLIDKEKLEARIDELLAGDGRRQADNVEGIALCALRECLVPYEEKKEECKHEGHPHCGCELCYHHAELGKCEECKDTLCTKCDGEGEKSEYNTPCGRGCTNHKYHCAKCNTAVLYSPANFSSRPQDMPNLCNNCNFTGKEPRKEQDTRTHAWETPESKQAYYSQDAVRKMLEDLKTRDNLAGNSKEVQEDRRHMNANIDKKIAEL